MTSKYFTYNKPKVIQALRYHFITRKEIKFLIIAINVFAILSAALFYLHKVSPLAFLVSSALWFLIMISLWFLLPVTIYNRTAMFKDSFKVDLTETDFILATQQGSKSWDWSEFSACMESQFFYHLYFNTRTFFLVPKDAFDEWVQSEAKALLLKKIPNRY